MAPAPRPTTRRRTASKPEAFVADPPKEPDLGLAPDDTDSAPRDTAPPKNKGGRPPGSKNKPKPAASGVSIADGVDAGLQQIGALLTVVGTARGNASLAYDGQVIIARSAEVGAMMSDLADDNPRLKAALERLLTGSSWGKVGVTTLGVLVPIAASHGMMPPLLAVPFIPKGLGLPPAPTPRPAPPEPEGPLLHVTVRDSTPNVPVNVGDYSGLPDAGV